MRTCRHRIACCSVLFSASPLRSGTPIVASFIMSDQRVNKRLKSHHQQSLTAFFAPKEQATAASEPTPATSTSEAPAASSSSTSVEDAKEATTTASLDPIIPAEVPTERSVTWNSYEDAIIYRRPPKSATAVRPKVAAFDMDGTLLVWRSATWPSRLEDYELWNPSVISKIQDLYDTQGYQLLIITNQGGIRKAHSGKRAARVQSLVEWLAHTIQRPLSVIMSTDKKAGYHKPSVLIWKKAQQLLGSKETPWNISESFFVGDSVGGDDDPQGGTDIGLAANVSAEYGETLRFHTPIDYFGPSSATRRSKGSGQEAPTIPPHAQQARAALCSGVVQNSSTPLVILLCGAQGSGKSTFASKLKEANGNSVSIFSQDTIRNGKAGTRQQVEAAVRETLRKQQAGATIIDRMHLDAAQREHFIKLLQEEGVDTKQQLHAIVFDPPVSVLTQRVRERKNHIVMGDKGAELAQKSAKSLVYPTYDEDFGLLSAVTGPESAERLLQRYRRILPSKEQDAYASTGGANSCLPESFPLRQYVQQQSNQPPSASAARPLQQLPSIVLGTMKMGRRTAATTIQLAMEVGGIAGVDCAPTYNNEDLVGPALDQDDVLCITKVPKRASTAKEVQSELDMSLSKLQRSSVDLLLLHWPTESAKLEEIWRAMEQLLRDGKTRALGVCNFNVAALNDLLSFCVIAPVVVQIERHPLLPQWEMVDFCAQRDIQLQAHSPLGQGKEELLQTVLPIASRYNGHTVAQVLLAWNIQQGIAVVPKCSTQDHLEQLKSLPVLASEDLMSINQLGKESTTRFVSPPFMYGSGAFCWGKHFRR